MRNQDEVAINQNENKPIVPEKSGIKISIWDIACIIFFAVGIAFLICFLDKFWHFLIFNAEVIILSAVAAMVIIFLCFISRKIGAVKIAALVIAGIMLAVNWYIYFRYIPKYGLKDACSIVNADSKYASAVIEPNYFDFPSVDGTQLEKRLNIYMLEDNPFYLWGYVLNVISDGKVITWLKFDCATGKYELFYEPKD